MILLKGIGADFRGVARTLARNRLWGTTVVLTLGLAIGLSTAVIAIINAAILEPLPLTNVDRLALVFESNDALGAHRVSPSYPNYQDYASATTTMEGLAAFTSERMIFRDAAGADRLSVARVSPSFFGIIGARPRIGRVFTEQEAQAGHNVAVLSHALWVQRFGAASSVVGETIRLEGTNVEVVGVIDPRDEFPIGTKLWLPLRVSAADMSRDVRRFGVIGLVRATETMGSAEAELQTIGRQILRQTPSSQAGWTTVVVPLLEHEAGATRRHRLFAVTGIALLILIAAVNVAHLQLSRSAKRSWEFGLQQALGAPVTRIYRRVVVESGVLILLAGIVGVPIALIVTQYFGSGSSDVLGEDAVIGHLLIRPRVLVFTSILLIGAVMTCSAVPLRQVKKAGAELVRGHDREHRPSSRHMQYALVGLEVFCATLLFVGTIAGWRIAWKSLNPDLGFDSNDVLVIHIGAETGGRSGAESAESFYRRLLENVSSLPDVRGAAVTDALPLAGGRTRMDARLFESNAVVSVDVRRISPGYMRTMDIAVRSGREFTSQDSRGSSWVALVNATAAKQLWPGQNPIGKRLLFGARTWREVIGVVGDVRHTGIDHAPVAEVYRPFFQQPTSDMSLVLRTDGSPSPELVTAIRRQIVALDPARIVEDVTTIDGIIDRSTAARRSATHLVTWLGITAIALTMLGAYGVTAHTVARRTRDLAVRMAVGATRRSIVGHLLLRSAIAAALGTLAGVGASIVLVRLAASVMFQADSIEQWSLALAGISVFLTAMASCWWPAYSGSAIDLRQTLAEE